MIDWTAVAQAYLGTVAIGFGLGCAYVLARVVHDLVWAARWKLYGEQLFTEITKARHDREN